jgi:hypothetical protein
MGLKNRIILPFRSVTLVENIQRIVQIVCPPMGVSDGIIDIGMHVIDYCVQILVEKELTDVGES